MYQVPRLLLIMAVLSAVTSIHNGIRHEHSDLNKHYTYRHHIRRKHNDSTSAKPKIKRGMIELTLPHTTPPPEPQLNTPANENKNTETVSSYWREELENHNDRYICSTKSCFLDLEQSRQMRLWQIKDQILKEIGIEAPPNMTGFVLPKTPRLLEIIEDVNSQKDVYLADNYSKQVNENFPADDPDIIMDKFFIKATDGPTWVKITDGHKLHYFNLGREHPSHLDVAILHLWLNPSHNAGSEYKAAQIKILKVEPPQPPQEFSRISEVNVNNFSRLRTIIKKTVEYSPEGKWAEIDVYSLVWEWLSKDQNFGFVINATTVDGSPLDVGMTEENAPLLQMTVKERKNDRRKRYVSHRTCKEEKPLKECCRYPMVVDFTKNKFDFIVAPKKYQANYCRGDCPFLYAQKIPHVTLIQQVVPSNISSSHGACCGGSDLAPLKMVYFDGKKLKIGTFNDMVVMQCSCT